MFDQTIRNYSGGLMAEYLSQENIKNTKFIHERYGIEAKRIIEEAKIQRQSKFNNC